MRTDTRHRIALLLFVACFSVARAQEITRYDKVMHLDSEKIETSNPNYVYLRVIKDYDKKLTQYQVLDYYKSGRLMKEATTTDKINLKFLGPVIEYYENGHKQISHSINSEQQYEGAVTKWYPDGSIKLIGEYLTGNHNMQDERGQAIKILQYWSEDHVQKVTDGKGEFAISELDFVISGAIMNGLRDGVWTGKYPMLNYSFTETYTDGAFVSGIGTDADGQQFQYDQLVVKPSPKGGLNAFYQFVSKNFRIPKVKRLAGKIITSFVVGRDGELKNIRVVKDIGHGTAEEAIRVLSLYKDFSPGIVRGISRPVQYSLPITIKVAD